MCVLINKGNKKYLIRKCRRRGEEEQISWRGAKTSKGGHKQRRKIWIEKSLWWWLVLPMVVHPSEHPLLGFGYSWNHSLNLLLLQSSQQQLYGSCYPTTANTAPVSSQQRSNPTRIRTTVSKLQYPAVKTHLIFIHHYSKLYLTTSTSSK